jgi:hypothetical protein
VQVEGGGGGGCGGPGGGAAAEAAMMATEARTRTMSGSGAVAIMVDGGLWKSLGKSQSDQLGKQLYEWSSGGRVSVYKGPGLP